MISPNMTATMALYSVFFMRFAWRVQPRNYLLFACHVSNCTVQLYNLNRWSSVQDWSQGAGHVIEQAMPKKMKSAAATTATAGVVPREGFAASAATPPHK